MGFGSLIQRITWRVSGQSGSGSGLYTPSTNQFDYAIGGVPLLSAAADQRPDTEKLVPQNKQQFENFQDPGEYSLQQWWLRSQGSFIGGAGVIYQDPDTQGEHKNIRYAHSVGCDPFTDVDNMLLLKECNPTSALNLFGANVGPAYVGAYTSTVFGDSVFIAKGNQVTNVTVGVSDLPAATPVQYGTAGSTSVLTGGMAILAEAQQQNVDSFVFLYDPATGSNTGIYRARAGFPSLNTALLYPVPGLSAEPNVTVGIGRGSVYFGLENSLYVLDPYASAPTALPTPKAAIPLGQTIVSVTDGPDAVYVGANSFNQGFIYKTTVDSTTGLVNGLQLTAVMPYGELINDAQSYVSTYLVVTTTNGIRVGQFSPGFSGAILNYGPKLITVNRIGLKGGPESGSGFGRIRFYGSRAYITTQGQGQQDGIFGLMAVDLSTVVQDVNTGANYNAYCTWDYVPNTNIPIIDVDVSAQGRPIFTYGTGSNAVVALEHQNNYISSGYFDTGRCRFNTIEPKLFKYVSVRTQVPLLGDVNVALLDDTGGLTNYITYGPTLAPGTTDIATPSPQGPRNWEAFRFTLFRNTIDPTLTPKFDAWQIKALPGVLKQRNIIRNFIMTNSQKDRNGQTYTSDTLALDQLNAIRQMAQRGDTITFQDLVQGIATQVIIDDYQFTMMTPPGPNKENYGGYLTLNLRTVADAVPPPTNPPPEVD
jgi:hypothetical protein